MLTPIPCRRYPYVAGPGVNPCDNTSLVLSAETWLLSVCPRFCTIASSGSPWRAMNGWSRAASPFRR